MTLAYVGGRAFDVRIAEFGYAEKEADRFANIVEALENKGWQIDTGVECWGACVVEDKEEFEMLKRDWQELKKQIK